MTQEQKDKTISASLTALIMLISVALCAWMGYKLPNPPIEEEGMGVAGEVLGEIEGFGNNNMANFHNTSNPAPASRAPEDSYTTSNEPSPVSKTPTNKNTSTSNKPTPDNNNNNRNSTSTQPQTNNTTNPNATFQRRQNGTSTEGNGAAEGSGRTGNPNGNPDAVGGTGNGIGVSYDLGGRGMRGNAPRPQGRFSKQGKIIVQIKVDRSGNVIEAKGGVRGSTLTDPQYVEAARQAALKAHFNAAPNAPEIQTGTITYIYKL